MLDLLIDSENKTLRSHEAVLRAPSTQEIERRQLAEEVDVFIKSGRQRNCPGRIADAITLRLPQTPVQINGDPSRAIFDLGSLRLWNTSSSVHPLTRSSIVHAQLSPLSGDKLDDLVAFLNATANRLGELGCTARAEKARDLAHRTAHFVPIDEAINPPLFDPGKKIIPLFAGLGLIDPFVSCEAVFAQWTRDKIAAERRIDHLLLDFDETEDIFSHSYFGNAGEHILSFSLHAYSQAAKLKAWVKSTEELFPKNMRHSQDKLIDSLKFLAPFLVERATLSINVAVADRLTIFTTMRKTTARLPRPVQAPASSTSSQKVFLSTQELLARMSLGLIEKSDSKAGTSGDKARTEKN